MKTVRLVSTVIIALLLTGCPPPVSDNSVSGSNAPPQSGDNPDAPAYEANDSTFNPKAIDIPYVSSGAKYSMILKTDDTLWAVGKNNLGQLGDDSNANKFTPVQVKTTGGSAMTEVGQVSTGWDHTVIVKKNGDVWAVGRNDFGQLGDDSTANKFTAVPVKTTGGEQMTGVDQVSTGAAHTMILKEGRLWGVGFNSTGQLSDGSQTSTQTPVAILTADREPMTEVAQVSAGTEYTMILKTDDSLWAVGDNRYGQLGDNTMNMKLLPVTVKTAAGEPITEVAQVSAGWAHTMILKKNGELWAVGRNDFGQLGNGNNDSNARELTPVAVLTTDGEPMTEVAQVSSGKSHSMILKKNGELWAVGDNQYGQLGDGNGGPNVKKSNPVQVKEIPAGGEPTRVMTGVAQISAGEFHTIIVKRDGTLWAVGRNDFGQLGDGSTENKLIAVEITVQ